MTGTRGGPAAVPHWDLVTPEDVQWSTRTENGSVELTDGVLRLRAEIDYELHQAFDRRRPELGDVDCIDARRVTFMGCPGLRLLVHVAEARAVTLPLWASPAVLRPLRLTGLHPLFDLRTWPS